MGERDREAVEADGRTLAAAWGQRGRAVDPQTVMMPKPAPRRAVVSRMGNRWSLRACSGAGRPSRRTPRTRVRVQPSTVAGLGHERDTRYGRCDIDDGKTEAGGNPARS
ncbi:hypothetical protein ABZ554_38750, partial [Streptomyces sp. NPDC020125]|uniref:hypothetical protein n=1 Tax=Streptomyces sp. NPDC020125 TaxID=3154593 RepID=UPI0033D48695